MAASFSSNPMMCGSHRKPLPHARAERQASCAWDSGFPTLVGLTKAAGKKRAKLFSPFPPAQACRAHAALSPRRRTGARAGSRVQRTRKLGAAVAGQSVTALGRRKRRLRLQDSAVQKQPPRRPSRTHRCDT
eukprot:scaffold3541_cov252-Pinguiococcus_pyrenoidosus.AAC.2